MTVAAPAALTLYRGDLMSDSFAEWITPERTAYRNLYLDTLLQLTQTHRTAGLFPTLGSNAYGAPNYQAGAAGYGGLFQFVGERIASSK